MNTTTEVKKKSTSPFAKVESPPAGAIPKKSNQFFENSLAKKKWQPLAVVHEEEDLSGSEEDGLDQEEDSDQHSDEEMQDVDDQESVLLAVDSLRKEFTQLKSIMFATFCLATSRTSTKSQPLPSISLESLQAHQTLLAMVEKYLSDTSKST